MKIINKTKDIVIAQEALLASTPWKRVKGLLGEKELKSGQALILKPCNSVHTFFMRFPIDVLFVDKNNRVIKAIPSLRPFRLTSVYFKADFVVELPAGTLQVTHTAETDILALS